MLRLFLCVVLLGLPSSLSAFAQNNLLRQLIDLPAPAPVVFSPNTKRERPPEFHSYKNVPPDDAPIEDLLDYWAKQVGGNPNQIGYSPKPSDETVERLLRFLEDNPEEIYNYLGSLPSSPETAEKVKDIYDKISRDPKSSGNYQTHQIKNWLKFNSREYSGELVKDLRRIKDENDYVSNEFQYALRSLARTDWDAASSLIDRLESDAAQPYSQILAYWTRYQRAIDTGDSSGAEKYRDKLKEIVEDKNAAWTKRDLAMDALVAGGDWTGRDDWYFSLLADETLLTIQDNGNTGLTTMVGSLPPETYRERLLASLKSDNAAVRSAAARNLVDVFDGSEEVLRALLPWLSDANWAKESRNRERSSLIEKLGETLISESVPILITILTNEEDKRFAAAAALAKYKDARGLPALKAILQPDLPAEARKTIIDAVIACGGFSDDEQIVALEAFAALASTMKGAREIEEFQNSYYDEEYGESGEEAEDEESVKPIVRRAAKPEQKSLPVQISVGKYVAEQTEPSEGLVARAIERIKILQRAKPETAAKLEEIMKKWQGRAIYLETVRQISGGEAEVEVILNALAQRKTMREKIPNEIINMRGASGLTRGIGACLAEEETDFLGILGQQDADAQTAMLGCARLLRIKLPIDEVALFLKSANKTLALAAERYLEAEDSVRARTIILAKYPNEAKILGARTAFIPDEKSALYSESLNTLFQSVNGSYAWTPDFSALNKISDKLRGEIKENAEMLAVYAILPNQEHGQQVVRVYKDRAVYTYYEDAARYREGNLTQKEYEAFYNSLLAENIDALTPKIENCHHGCPSGEFVMFGRGGGRRVFYSAFTPSDPLAKLYEFFDSFRSGDTKLHYRLADKIKGLEVLLADDKFPVHTVLKKDADVHFVVEDKAQQEENQKTLYQMISGEGQIEDETDEQRVARYQAYQKRREETEAAHLSWHKLENGKIGAIVPQSFEAQFLYDQTQVSKFVELDEIPRAWQVRTRGGEIRTSSGYENNGLFRAAPGQNPSKIRAGRFSNPVVSADGKWAVASKITGEWSEPKTAVRVNLQTGAESKINLAPADTFQPVAFLPAHNKFLILRAKGYFAPHQMSAAAEPETKAEKIRPEISNENSTENSTEKAKPNPSPAAPEYYLLDANTGSAQIIKGEFRPLHQQTFRPLQPTGNAHECWAAIYDAKSKTTDVGRYNDKTFAFQTVVKLPEIMLDSMNIWVDEKEAKIYFAYQGHLLSVPMK